EREGLDHRDYATRTPPSPPPTVIARIAVIGRVAITVVIARIAVAVGIRRGSCYSRPQKAKRSAREDCAARVISITPVDNVRRSSLGDRSSFSTGAVTLDKLAALMGPAKTLAGRTANTVAPQNATAWADFTLLRLVRISTSLAGPTFVKTCQVSFRGKRDSSRGRAICR